MRHAVTIICPDVIFRAPAQPVIYDSSAGLIAACGLLELSKLVGEYEKDMYYNAACRFVKAAAENFTDWSDRNRCNYYSRYGILPLRQASLHDLFRFLLC